MAPRPAPEVAAPPDDPAARTLAEDCVSRVVGAHDAGTARLLAACDTKKNLVVAFRSSDEPLVLKIYRQSVRYTLQALKNPLSRYLSRAFTIRSLAAARVRAEVDGIDGFRLAGLRTFEVVARPRRDALVFRYEAGGDLRELLRCEDDPAVARRYVERVATDLAERHRIACDRNDLRMIHPAPRVQHVWVRPDDTLLYLDFEDRVNPVLRVAEAAAMETESFFFNLLRLAETADAATIAAARRCVGDDVMRRWHEHDARRRRRLSGSARRRGWVLPAVLAAGAGRPSGG